MVRLCEALIAEGEDVTLAALDLAPLDAPPDFVRTFPLGMGPRRLGRSPAMMRWLREAVASGKLELLHSHGMWQMTAVYPGWLANAGKVKVIASPRGAFSEFAMKQGSALKRVFWPLLQRPSLERCACFHATAEAEYLDVRNRGFRQPVAVIPNGIDIPAEAPVNSSRSRTLLYLGRIHRIKGLDLLLRAWRQVQDRYPEWDLSIAGDDRAYYGASGYLGAVKEMASQLQLKRVQFLGHLSGARKASALASAEVLILPSYSENFGVVVAEALAAGRPAIVAQGAPWGGLVAHGAGWWPANTDEDIAHALDSALGRSRSELEAMGRKGRLWMESDFSWARVGRMMAATYRWTVSGGEPPAWVRLQ